MLRVAWSLARGYWFRPWENPYLRWRIETYWGIPADSLDAGTFGRFVWQHRGELWRYLRWAGRQKARFG